MTAPLTPSEQPAVTMPVASQSRGRRYILLSCLVLAAAGVAWWWFHRAGPRTVPPPVPASVRDSEIQQAIERAREKVLQDPDSAAKWGDLGLVLLAHVYDRDANVCFAEAARLAPADPRWAYAQGLIALKREPDKALPMFQTALAAAADGWPEYQSAARMQIAETLLERWKLDEAATYFRQEQDQWPTSPRAALGLGQIAAARGDDAAAKPFLQLAQGSEFAAKKATMILARLARTGGDADLANQLEKQVAKMPVDPSWPDPLSMELMQVEVGRKARERKIDWFEKQRRFDQAAALWLEQIDKYPKHAEAYVGAGINLLRLKDFDRALPLLRKSVELEPDNDQAQYTLALGLFTLAENAGDRGQAADLFRQALDHAKRAAELRPDHGGAYLLWGRSLKYLGQPEEAIAPLKKGVACNPADFDLQFSLGEALLEAGRGQDAEVYLENARRLDPKHPLPVRLLERVRK